MIALLILAVSVTALVQFAVCQWRSMWISVAAQPLSECLQAAVGLAPGQIESSHFELLCEKHLPALSEWADTELTACARYAAAVLDERLNANLAFASETRAF
jgi:hypothetical protein